MPKGWNEKGNASGLGFECRQGPELAQYAVVMSGSLVADVAGMGLMADAFMTLSGCRQFGMDMQSSQQQHRQVNSQ